ncbi:MAG TPA: serine/threonine-protein kinase [Ktedonobacteraceae bacterium]
MPLATLKNNRYRIVRPLGSGSTGEVYLVEDNINNRQEVILKLLHAYEYPATLDTLQTPHLFEFEAKALAQLSHPNILPLLDYNTETIDGKVVPFIVMPYCPDGSLATWLANRTDSDVLTLEDTARIIHQIADALQYAHNQGIVHRDVKAANIFIRNKLNGPPDMLVADFGFAQPIPEALAQGMDVRGTPEYMAPEQWEGQVVPASDQYALGVMVYQLLTGQLPFQGSVEQVRTEHLSSWPTPPSTLNPTLPRELDAVVARALAKKPGERFATVTAFADAFAQAIQPAPPPVYLAAPPPLPPEETTMGDIPVTPPPEPPARRLSTGMIVLIAAVVLLLIMGTWGFVVLANSGNSSQSSANATATANTNLTTTADANANGNTTATALANATVNANATATASANTNANANATATANANANATATASANSNANANATATAQANANATATVAPAAALSGNWTNGDTNTTGITTMAITNNGLNVSVQTTSNFPTANCNWGTKSNQYSSPFTIVFIVTNCGPSTTETLTISTQGPQLKVDEKSSTTGKGTYLLNKASCYWHLSM